jgi:hypothetical protein
MELERSKALKAPELRRAQRSFLQTACPIGTLQKTASDRAKGNSNQDKLGETSANDK